MNKNSFFYFLRESLGRLALKVYSVLIDFVSGRIVFIEPDHIAGFANLEQKYELIRSEYLSVVAGRNLPGVQEFFNEQRVITEGKNWRSFPFFLFGHEYMDNTRMCPETTRLLLSIPGMCAAMYSVLGAGKRITPHRGPFKGVLRYHLGLVIPKESSDCYILVDGQKRNWEEGKGLLFDDTHVHEAVNSTDTDRVILFVDIVRPLPFPLNKLNKFFFNAIAKSEFITEAVEGYKPFGNIRTREVPIQF